MKGIILLVFLVLQVYSYTCFGVASTSPSACSSQGACVAQDVCSCHSGYAGAQCTLKSANTCFWNVNSQTMTNFYPVLDMNSLTIENNNLIFNIFAPLVLGRLNTTMYIQDPSNPDCGFPGKYTTNTLSNTYPCNNVIGFSLPWSVGKSCGWNVQTLSDRVVYGGNIFINHLENIGNIRGLPVQRKITRIIPIEVTFMTEVAVANTIKVNSPVNLFAAVTQQTYQASSVQVKCL